MPIVANGYTGARSGTGLLITVAIHAALGAALLSLGVVSIPNVTRTEPIKIRNIPVTPPEKVTPPVMPDQVDLVFAPPVVNIAPDLPPAPSTGLTSVDVPPNLPPVAVGPLVDPAPPAPVMVLARLDSRFAARFQPPYPASSERAEEEGVVMVRVRIGTDGRVLAAELKASSGHARLDEAAVAHARRAWRFTPATRDGVPVESWREVPVRFELVNG
ncbi:energy transducer TonB [Sphingoaurantiacus capsulatus]|uniref:Energy transducer TonB n=1 Tax=Sphingoaurantiacus capsulatus TaxID=1771310 RepID=A0ABV7X6R8_9SPHN